MILSYSVQKSKSIGQIVKYEFRVDILSATFDV